MNADRKPEGSGALVGSAKEKSSLNGYRDSTPKRGPGIQEMYQSEQKPGHRQRRPCVESLIYHVEKDTSEYHLLATSHHEAGEETHQQIHTAMIHAHHLVMSQGGKYAGDHTEICDPDSNACHDVFGSLGQ